MTWAHRQWEQGNVGWQGTGAGGRGRGLRFTTGSVRTSLLGAAEPPPWRRRHLRLQGTGLRWAVTRLPQGRTRGGGTGGEARGVLMWTHVCFWTGWTSALKGGPVERAHPEEAWETTRSIQPLLMARQRARPAGDRTDRQGKFKARAGKTAPGAWRQCGCRASSHHRGNVGLGACVTEAAHAPSEWGDLGGGRFRSPNLYTHLGSYGRVNSLPLPPWADSLLPVDKGCDTHRARTYGFWECDTGDGSVKKPDSDDVQRVQRHGIPDAHVWGQLLLRKQGRVTHCAASTSLSLPWNYENTLMLSKKKCFFDAFEDSAF